MSHQAFIASYFLCMSSIKNRLKTDKRNCSVILVHIEEIKIGEMTL